MLGIDRKTTYSIPLTSGVTYIGMATAANTAQLQLGDCLNSNDVGHVVLVTDLAYNSSGNLTQIEITEQTPPQLKRSYYTPSELGSKYGGYYGIYRYSGTVPAAPNAFTTKYYPACGSSYTSLYPALESIGAYYYTYATSVAGAQTDANNMLQWIKGKTFEYPIYFDYEYSSQDSLSSTTAKNICLTFCAAMAAAGYLTGIYTGYYKSTQLPIDAICAKYEIWIANYWDYTYETLSSGYSTKYGMYQYTDRNYIGSNGPYDGDVAFKDYPAIVKKYGFNGYADPDAYFDQCTFYPAHCQVKTAKTTSVNTLPCAKNTNGSVQVLSAEADQTFTAIGMYRNTSENLWYQVVLDGGEIAYLYSGHCTFVQELQTDLSLKDSTVPGNLKDGESFGVKGTLEAAYHQLQEVKITVYSEGSPVAGGSEQITGHVYSLEGSDLAAAIDFATLTPGSYLYEVSCTYHSYYAAAEKEPAVIQGTKVLLQSAFIVQECEHSYTSKLVQAATCTKEGILKQTCDKCGKTFQSTIVALGHRYESMQVEATCTEPGGTGYTCQTCGDSFLVETVQPLGHRYSEGKCSNCGEADPGLVVTQPTLTLKSPTLEFKDMITVNAFFTAQNTENVVEMGMITYEEKVGAVSVDTADHVIPGTTYDENTGRYCARSQGIHAKYLGDTVYLAVYAKLTDGSYVYTKLAPYSPVQYATNQLKNSTDVKLKKLVAAMLNYGAEAQLYFGHNTGSLANASLNSDQKAMPEVYRADMVKAVPAASAAKQGALLTIPASAAASRPSPLRGHFVSTISSHPGMHPPAALPCITGTKRTTMRSRY